MALLGGFVEVARRTGLPLRLLEVGAAAGLILARTTTSTKRVLKAGATLLTGAHFQCIW